MLVLWCLSTPQAGYCADTNQNAEVIHSVTNLLALTWEQATDMIDSQMKAQLAEIQRATSNRLEEINLKLKEIGQEPLDFKVRRVLSPEQKEYRNQFLQFHQEQHAKREAVRHQAGLRFIALDELRKQTPNQAPKDTAHKFAEPER